MKRLFSLLVFLVILISIYGSGCVGGGDPELVVNETVVEFLTHVNDGEHGSAYAMYQGMDFLTPASVMFNFKNKNIVQNSIKDIRITDIQVSENVAVATADCTIADFEGGEVEKGEFQIQVYFRIQLTDVGWIITKVAFNEPIELSDEGLIDVEIAATPIDPLVDNAAYIFIGAVILLSLGLYLHKKEKKEKEGGKTDAKGSGKGKKKGIDLSNATPMEKQAIAQFVKFVPSPQHVTGKKSSVDVWVKNFSQQSYENFAVTAKFSDDIKAKKTDLKFGTVSPGQTVKQTWTVTPKTQGWVAIQEPTVVFEYMGNRYMGVLDPIWLQAQ
ncbi:MAG: hypothetical protein K8R64_02275 [Methanosarcinaceae archaeon]|nr:hypothetical protein [Methanosarcinaceae archaeon]